MMNLTIGMDLGDPYSHLYVLDDGGTCVETGRIRTTRAGLQRWFSGQAAAQVVLEADMHSPWASRALQALGHEVIVANPRKLRVIYENDSKDDRVDAECLARVGRLDPALLKGITHRGEAAQADLAVLHSRDVLVRTRTQLINHARDVVKAMGERLPRCTAAGFAPRCAAAIPEQLEPALAPVFAQLERVQAAHYILGPHRPECDLRRHGERIAGGGGKNAKKPAVIAVARKLAVLLHHHVDQRGGVRAAAERRGAGAGELRPQTKRRERTGVPDAQKSERIVLGDCVVPQVQGREHRPEGRWTDCSVHRRRTQACTASLTVGALACVWQRGETDRDSGHQGAP